MQHVLAFGNVPFRGGLVEFSATVRTLDIIAGVTGRGWRQIPQVPTCRQVRLHHLGGTNRLDEFLVFAPPIWLQLRLLRMRLKRDTRMRECTFRELSVHPGVSDVSWFYANFPPFHVCFSSSSLTDVLINNSQKSIWHARPSFFHAERIEKLQMKFGTEGNHWHGAIELQNYTGIRKLRTKEIKIKLRTQERNFDREGGTGIDWQRGIPTSCFLATPFLAKASSSVPLTRNVIASNCFLFLFVVFAQICSWRLIRSCAKLRPHVLQVIKLSLQINH